MADVPGNTSTTSTLSVGSTITGSLETLGDHDWYRISLSAGQSISVTLNGTTFQDTYLYIRDSAGNVLFSNDDISDQNLGSEVGFSATYSGTYYIDVGAWNDAATGGYQVSVQPYSPPPVVSNDVIANQLVSGFWNGDSHHFNVRQGGTITVNISTLNAGEQTLARAALAEWTDITGVQFREVLTGGQIVFDHSEQADGTPIAATDANWSNHIISSAHVQISTSWVNRYGTSLYSYSMQTYVHEIGHALGLGHAGDYNNTARYPYDALFSNDAWSTSIMSYFDQSDNTYFAGQGFTTNYVVTPMVADILAMQQLYGLSTTTRTGDTTYGYNSNAGGVYDAGAYPRAAYTIFDSAGNDTLDFSGSAASQVINLNPETFSNVNGYVGNLSIARGVVIENAIGGSGADMITGTAGNNVLRGNGGSDTLTGGGGNDTFLDTTSGHNGDRITDFSAGDAIVFSNAAAGSFTFNVTGSTLTYTGGTLTFGSVLPGTLAASAAAGGGIQLTLASATTLVPHPALNDFSGDGRSDILWRNDSGLTSDWLGQPNGGVSSNSANFQINVATQWQIAGSGDFNGDGKVDILWRHDSGLISDWLGQTTGGFIDNGAASSINPGSAWHIAGTGDFNGDGRDDILWRNDDGLVSDWLAQSNGGFIDNAVAFKFNPGTQWQIAATGDFNGDGRDDILWRHNSGLISVWLAQPNGSFVDANASINPGSQWSVVGAGDFNGDGRDDILWRNSNGLTTEWLGQSNGSLADNSANFQVNPGTRWHVSAIGDFNGDGRDDILWRHDSGLTTDWLGQANGSFADNSASFSVNPGTSWHIQDPAVHDPFPFA